MLKLHLLSSISLLTTILVWVPAIAAELPPISGMALLEDRSFLVVTDAKANSPEERVGVLTVGADGAYSFEAIAVDWPGAPANDLESVARLPGPPGEFLAAESGCWTDRTTGEFHQGRIFWLAVVLLDGVWEAVVREELMIPEDYREIEGMVVMEGSDSRPSPVSSTSGYDKQYRQSKQSSQFSYLHRLPGDEIQVDEQLLPPTLADSSQEQVKPLLVVLGLRGGTYPYEPPVLHWGYADFANSRLDICDGSGLPLEHFTSGYPTARGCSDLYLDPAGVLWVAAAEDTGDSGPFRSSVWRFGPFMPDRLSFFDHYFYIDQLNHGNLQWTMDGIKIEAIAAPVMPGSVLSYATDDEAYGGIWRPLGSAVLY